MMFKEQLHESFDAISPSPELLDRISAMMSEEVSRPKPSIKMNAVRYGGIAAALALAAGGTFVVMQNANGRIGTSNKTTESIMAETYAAEAANDAFDGIAGAAPEAYGMETTAGAAEAEAAEEAEETEAAENVMPDAELFSVKNDTDDAGQTVGPDNEINAKSATDDTSDLTEFKILSVTTTAPEMVAVADNECDECADDEDSFYDDAAEPSYDSSAVNAGGMDNGTGLPETADNAVPGRADPATGGGSLEYEEPFSAEFLNIPLPLKLLAEGAVVQTEEGYIPGERWHDYVNSFPPDEYSRYEYTADGDVIPESADDPDMDMKSGYREITGVDDWLNTYSFIKYFGLSDADVRAGLAGIYTDEQTDILLSGDKARINAAFASDYAIVRGEKIYPPIWLDRHSTDEWKKAGITKKDIREKYDKLTHLPNYSEIIQNRLTAKLDEFLK